MIPKRGQRKPGTAARVATRQSGADRSTSAGYAQRLRPESRSGKGRRSKRENATSRDPSPRRRLGVMRCRDAQFTLVPE